MLAAIRAVLRAFDAIDVAEISLVGKVSYADMLVIASIESGPQIMAITRRIVEAARALHIPPPSTEGLDKMNWVLIDTGDIIVHLFRPEVREFYRLEQIWDEQICEAEPPE